MVSMKTQTPEQNGPDAAYLLVSACFSVFESIPELPSILLWVLNVYGAIIAVPYIVLKRFNANVVRNISGPLLTGAAAAAPA